MNKVVTRVMLAKDLPAEIRGDVDPDHRVEVRVVDLGGGEEERRARLRGYVGVAERQTTVEDAVERIRQLRDEWD
jgi:tartrate dehydratase alpha subunit/fumarate hydratase class I-like protein